MKMMKGNLVAFIETYKQFNILMKADYKGEMNKLS